MSLSDERVVVVVGTSGMGLATARLAAELGAAVVAAGRRPLEEREPLAGVAQARVDTTDEASVRALFDEVGELDHLFVSSSPGSAGPLLEQGWRPRGHSSMASCSALGCARAMRRLGCARAGRSRS